MKTREEICCEKDMEQGIRSEIIDKKIEQKVWATSWKNKRCKKRASKSDRANLGANVHVY